MKVITLDTSPAEQDPIRMMPAAISGGNFSAFVIANPTSGIMVNCPTTPINTAHGIFATPAKSVSFICVPMPNITACTMNRMSHLFRRSSPAGCNNCPG